MTRQCWICYAEEEEEDVGSEDWIQPCLCKGTTRWVHQDCLLDWVNSRLVADANSVGQMAGGPLATADQVQCPQCHANYRLVESHLLPGRLLTLIDQGLIWKDRMVTAILVSSASASVWLVCFAYGAATFTIAIGPEAAKAFFIKYGTPLLTISRTSNGLDVARSYLKLIVGIPFIPVAILSNRFKFLSGITSYILPILLWDGYDSLSLNWPPSPNLTALLLPHAYQGYRYLRRTILAPIQLVGSSSSSLTGSSNSSNGSSSPLIPVDSDEEILEEAEVALRISEDSIVSLLVMPAASSIVGWMLFGRFQGLSSFHRTCLGGLTVSVLTDAGRLLYQYQSAYAKQSRRILNRRIEST